ncbi:MAG: leucine-rich repeat domain-containing protein, partial [Promethearchaeota archaeon]
MELTPETIFQKYQKKELDKDTTINYLISLIENSNNENFRVDSLKIIRKIQGFDDKLFRFIENLLISDSNVNIRCQTAKIIRSHYLKNSISLLNWSLKHETDIECLSIIIKTLIEIDTLESKTILFEEIKKIKKLKQLHAHQMVSNNHFRKPLKVLLKKTKFKDLSSELLGDILLNYKTILTIKNKFYSVYYELKDTKLIKLDLSDVEFEVRGWKAEFKNNIQYFSDIPGLYNLKSLESLYLSNNIISTIDGIQELSNLSYLDLSNNKIKDIETLNVF